VILSSSSCAWFTEYVLVHDQFPLIEKPETPQLHKIGLDDLNPLTEEVKANLLDNIKAMKTQTKQYKAAVDTYNAAAEKHNKNIKIKKEDKVKNKDVDLTKESRK
jgi:biotin-(acetyl-CoA carboxylase) ligase